MDSEINIKQYDFNEELGHTLEKDSASDRIMWATNWPTVYILNNKKKAYIGETVNVINRLKQHSNKLENNKLTTVNILIDNKSNKSFTLDVESLLIRYMSADKKFELLNGNMGLVNSNYFNRDSYRSKFKEDIWPKLRKLGVVNRDLLEIENDNLFKYSPYTALNSEQYDVIEKIRTSLSNGKDSEFNILINGSPGTGKTLLGIHLMKLLKSKPENYLDDEIFGTISDIQQYNKKIALVIPQSSLRETLKKVFDNVSNLNSNMVISPHEAAKSKYDLLIIDEAHRLRRRKSLTNYGHFDKNNEKLGFDKEEGTELDWIIKQSKRQIFFYDEDQSVKPTDVRSEEFRSKVSKQKHFEIHLTSQFRVLAGKDYISYVKNILNVKQTEKKSFGSYDLKLFDSFKEMRDEILAKEKEFGLCRVVAGYGWDWKSKKDFSKYDIEIEGIKLRWNSTALDWSTHENALYEVGCIHTIQGYDLNYTGVIFGPEISFDKEKQKIVVKKENYYDIKGKSGIKTQKELENYIKNIYSVLMTRGIKGTYVYVVDEDLREYLRKFI